MPAGRPRFSVSLLPPLCPARPICSRNSPSAVNLRMCASVAALPPDPDVALVIDVNPVLVLRPFVPVAGTAPGAQHRAVRRELDHRRRRHAAHAVLAALAGVEGPRTVQHPDVVVGVDVDARDLPEHPVVGQLARPERVDAELRDVLPGLGRLGLSGARGAGGQRERHERARNSDPVQSIHHAAYDSITTPRRGTRPTRTTAGSAARPPGVGRPSGGDALQFQTDAPSGVRGA